MMPVNVYAFISLLLSVVNLPWLTIFRALHTSPALNYGEQHHALHIKADLVLLHASLLVVLRADSFHTLARTQSSLSTSSAAQVSVWFWNFP
jgi:hypothetical protein